MADVNLVLATIFLVAAVKSAVPPHERPLSQREKLQFIKEVKDQLKDPDSAKFKWTVLSSKTQMTESSKGHFVSIATYCGMVNAKNSFGGYTGFMPYASTIAILDDKIVSIAVGAIATEENVVSLTELCVKNTGFNPAAAQ